MDLSHLGKRIQDLRGERGMTLQDLADASSVSVSMLSAVERGQKAATVTVLDRIASGLGISLPALIALAADSGVVVRRAAEQDVIDEPGGWQRTILTPVVAGVNFEWIRTVLPAGRDAGWYPAYAPGSHEFVVVDSGILRLRLEGREIDLTAGDSVYFAATATPTQAPYRALTRWPRSSCVPAGQNTMSARRLTSSRSSVPVLNEISSTPMSANEEIASRTLVGESHTAPATIAANSPLTL